MTISLANKLNTDLQQELVSYGLMRETAKTNAPKLSGSGPQYFGLNETAEEFNMYFTNDLRKINKQPESMQLAIVAPENDMFDMIEPKDYTKGLKLRDEASVRRMLSNLLDTL